MTTPVIHQTFNHTTKHQYKKININCKKKQQRYKIQSPSQNVSLTHENMWNFKRPIVMREAKLVTYTASISDPFAVIKNKRT